MALSRRRHTMRDAHESARAQAPSSGTQPTSDSGTLQRRDHVADGDVGGGLRQLVAAAHPARRLDEPSLAQTREDALQERRGDALLRGDLRQRHGPATVVTGQVDHRPQTVFAAR